MNDAMLTDTERLYASVLLNTHAIGLALKAIAAIGDLHHADIENWRLQLEDALDGLVEGQGSDTDTAEMIEMQGKAVIREMFTIVTGSKG